MDWSISLTPLLCTIVPVVCLAYTLRTLDDLHYRTEFAPAKVFDRRDILTDLSRPGKSLLRQTNSHGRFAAIAVKTFYCLSNMPPCAAVKIYAFALRIHYRVGGLSTVANHRYDRHLAALACQVADLTSLINYNLIKLPNLEVQQAVVSKINEQFAAYDLPASVISALILPFKDRDNSNLPRHLEAGEVFSRKRQSAATTPNFVTNSAGTDGPVAIVSERPVITHQDVTVPRCMLVENVPFRHGEICSAKCPANEKRSDVPSARGAVWTVAQIADYLGVTRSAVYANQRHLGVKRIRGIGLRAPADRIKRLAGVRDEGNDPTQV